MYVFLFSLLASVYEHLRISAEQYISIGCISYVVQIACSCTGIGPCMNLENKMR
jgi:hypothetical protein